MNQFDMVDIVKVENGVEIILSDDKVWINVDGICALRISGVDKRISVITDGGELLENIVEKD